VLREEGITGVYARYHYQPEERDERLIFVFNNLQQCCHYDRNVTVGPIAAARLGLCERRLE
jgi:hypothetical protein